METGFSSGDTERKNKDQSRKDGLKTELPKAERLNAARAEMWRCRKISLPDRERDARPEPGLAGSSVSECEITAGRKPWSVPTDPEIEALYRKYEVPDRVQRHMKAVAAAADRIVSEACDSGIFYDAELIRAAALLHDIARTRKNHPEEGAKILASEGFELVGMIVREHHSTEMVIRYPDKVSEEDLLYYADKIVQEDRIVSLKERFEKSLSKVDSEEGRINYKKRMDKAYRIEQLLTEEKTAEQTETFKPSEE